MGGSPCAASAGDKGMSVLRFRRAGEGDPLPALHFQHKLSGQLAAP